MANYSYYPVYNPTTGKYDSVFASSPAEASMKASKNGFHVTNPNTPMSGDTNPNHRSNNSTDYAYWYNGRKSW